MENKQQQQQNEFMEIVINRQEVLIKNKKITHIK